VSQNIRIDYEGGGTYEAIDHILYSRVVYAKRSMEFFRVALGQKLPSGHKATRKDTNLYCVSMLPRWNYFVIRGFGLWAPTGVRDHVRDQIEDADFRFVIGAKTFSQFPAWHAHWQAPGKRPTLPRERRTPPTKYIPFPLDRPMALNPLTNFAASVEWPDDMVPNTGAWPLTVCLIGELHRPVA